MLQGCMQPVIWKHATLTLSHGKPLQMTEPCGSNKCHKDWKVGRLPSKKKMKKEAPGEQLVISRTTKTHIKHLSSHAGVAAEIANPGLASTATQDDAHQQPLRVLLHNRSTDEWQQCCGLKCGKCSWQLVNSNCVLYLSATWDDFWCEYVILM